jgi:hypothetical protein
MSIRNHLRDRSLFISRHDLKNMGMDEDEHADTLTVGNVVKLARWFRCDVSRIIG